MIDKLKSLVSNQYLIWLVLSLPAIGLLKQFSTGNARYGMLMHISGEFAARFLVISLVATPIALLFPKFWGSKWLIQNRRFFGVAAFSYSLLHTIFYVLEESYGKIVDEFFNLGILTGWVAFFIFIPLAATSTNAAVRRMGPNWKKLQRWVYLAAILTILHWVYVDIKHTHWLPALVHFSPFILFSIYRIWLAYAKPSQNAA